MGELERQFFKMKNPGGCVNTPGDGRSTWEIDVTEISLFGASSTSSTPDGGVMHYPETGQALRWVRLDGILWMHFADICKGTGHGNPRSAIHLVEDDDKRKIDMRTISAGQTAVSFPTPGTGNAEAWFVNEDGFATVGLAGRGDGPRVFRRWVVKVVIPAFRQMVPAQRAIPASFADALELAAKQQREIEAKDALIAGQQKEIEAGAEKVAVYNDWLDPDNAVETTDFAKRIGLRSAQQLNGHLRDLGILRRDVHPRTKKPRNLPTADWGHCFKVVPTKIPTGGFVDVAWILPEGQLEIVEELRNHGLIDV